MPALVLVVHGTDNACHVFELLAVLFFSPLVCPVREVFLIIVGGVVISIEKVLEVVKTYNILALGLCAKDCKSKGENQCKDSFHTD